MTQKNDGHAMGCMTESDRWTSSCLHVCLHVWDSTVFCCPTASSITTVSMHPCRHAKVYVRLPNATCKASATLPSHSACRKRQRLCTVACLEIQSAVSIQIYVIEALACESWFSACDVVIRDDSSCGYKFACQLIAASARKPTKPCQDTAHSLLKSCKGTRMQMQILSQQQILTLMLFTISSHTHRLT